MTTKLRAGSVCTGYAGLDLAVEAVLGTELAWVADNDKGAAAILAHRYPGVPNLGDIAAVDWAAVEPVDVLTAGFPCQDVSCAGARRGLREGTRTGVWAHVARAIEALRPSLVMVENVRGLLSAGADSPVEWCPGCMGETDRDHLLRASGAVLGDLAGLVYDTRGAVVSAADAGAPHRRERVFILAWPADRQSRAAGDGSAGLAVGQVQHHGPELAATERGDRDRPAADAEREPVRVCARGLSAAPGAAERPRAQRQRLRPDNGDGGGPAQDPDSPTSGERWLPVPGQAESGGPWADAGRPGGAPATTDADGRGCEGIRFAEPSRQQRAPGSRPDRSCADGRLDDTAGAPANSESARLYGSGDTLADSGKTGPRWRAATEPERHGDQRVDTLADAKCGLGNGRPDQPLGRSHRRTAPADDSPVADIAWGVYEPAIRRWEILLGRPAPRPTEPGRTGERLSPRFVEWMMGLPEGWVTDVPGLSRNTQLKALGNGVVPQQAEMALRLLLERAFGWTESAA